MKEKFFRDKFFPLASNGDKTDDEETGHTTTATTTT
jgi:hypothetical protein